MTGINLSELAKQNFAEVSKSIFELCMKWVHQSDAINSKFENPDINNMAIVLEYKDEKSITYKVLYGDYWVPDLIRESWFSAKKTESLEWKKEHIYDEVISTIMSFAPEFEGIMPELIEFALEQFNMSPEKGQLVFTMDGIKSGNFLIYKNDESVGKISFEVINKIRDMLKDGQAKDEIRSILTEKGIKVEKDEPEQVQIPEKTE